MDNIMVSINCLTFNHEKYLRKCLDGFLIQKTNFKFEVLIHDDASTDGTQDIIKEYENKYPDIIKPIYQNENQYSKGVIISWKYQYPRAKGKYIAFCEGDDYWVDEYKLQKQFDAMERNPDCSICLHKVELIDNNGAIGRFFPRHNEFFEIVKDNTITSNDFLKYLCEVDGYPIQTSAYFIRFSVIESVMNAIPDFIKGSFVGDLPLLLLCASKGNVYYINEVMSFYRTNHSGSWVLNTFSDLNKRKKHYENSICIFNDFNKYTEYKYDGIVQSYIKRREFDVDRLDGNYKNLLSKKYREVFWNLSFIGKLHIFLLAYFPRVTKYIDKLREKKL